MDEPCIEISRQTDRFLFDIDRQTDRQTDRHRQTTSFSQVSYRLSIVCTVISRAMETTQQELEERRHHLKHLQNDIYSIREQVHQLEDQEQRYRQRGRILSNQLQEILEKMRRLDKFTGGMASNSSVREDV